MPASHSASCSVVLLQAVLEKVSPASAEASESFDNGGREWRSLPLAEALRTLISRLLVAQVHNAAVSPFRKVG